jgi:hypothetical protein
VPLRWCRTARLFVVSNRDTEDIRVCKAMPSAAAGTTSRLPPIPGLVALLRPVFDEPSYREVTRYEAIAEIAMFNGVKPANDANAFNAREVQANLQGRVTRPPAQ